MTALALAALAAGWLGILTSMSPCPLATNIAAVSFVGRRAAHPAVVLLSGGFYALGRMAAYVVVGAALVSGLLAVPGVAFGLQRYMNMLLGPVLLIAGVLMLGVLPVPSVGSRLFAWAHRRAEAWGEAGAFFLGFLFALSFCPVSAGLFFGSLIPLATAENSRLLLPAVYGLGTALPVLFFAIVIAFSANALGRVFGHVTKIELWARRITAGIFLLVGGYFFLAHTLKVI